MAAPFHFPIRVDPALQRWIGGAREDEEEEGEREEEGAAEEAPPPRATVLDTWLTGRAPAGSAAALAASSAASSTSAPESDIADAGSASAGSVPWLDPPEYDSPEWGAYLTEAVRHGRAPVLQAIAKGAREAAPVRAAYDTRSGGTYPDTPDAVGIRDDVTAAFREAAGIAPPDDLYLYEHLLPSARVPVRAGKEAPVSKVFGYADDHPGSATVLTLEPRVTTLDPAPAVASAAKRGGVVVIYHIPARVPAALPALGPKGLVFILAPDQDWRAFAFDAGAPTQRGYRTRIDTTGGAPRIFVAPTKVPPRLTTRVHALLLEPADAPV